MNKATQLLRSLEKQGWRIKHKRKHYQAFSPDGVTVVTLSMSPSDWRGWDNVMKHLKRGGYRGKEE
jgi:predicted RNA binding protein YcfA (HicA-like mRNA interferase family)